MIFLNTSFFFEEKILCPEESSLIGNETVWDYYEDLTNFSEDNLNDNINNIEIKDLLSGLNPYRNIIIDLVLSDIPLRSFEEFYTK